MKSAKLGPNVGLTPNNSDSRWGNSARTIAKVHDNRRNCVNPRTQRCGTRRAVIVADSELGGWKQ